MIFSYTNASKFSVFNITVFHKTVLCPSSLLYNHYIFISSQLPSCLLVMVNWDSWTDGNSLCTYDRKWTHSNDSHRALVNYFTSTIHNS